MTEPEADPGEPAPGGSYCADLFNSTDRSFQALLRWEDDAGAVSAEPFARLSVIRDDEDGASAYLYALSEERLPKHDPLLGSVAQGLRDMVRENRGWRLVDCTFAYIVAEPARVPEWRPRHVTIRRTNEDPTAYRIVVQGILDEKLEAMDVREESYHLLATLDVFHLPEDRISVTYTVYDESQMSRERAGKFLEWVLQEAGLPRKVEVDAGFGTWYGQCSFG